jgi:SNF2 family DNA or RNA helicase
MQNQELGRAITITEVEEAVNLDLGWRAEAQAQASVLIRGGVLADLPSFGKTVTTIALIQSEFEQHAPDALLRENQQFRAVLPGRIDTPATLIVCPAHITLQWQTELKKFLGAARLGVYNILLIESFSQLQDLSISAVRESRVIIVSWSVFAQGRVHFTPSAFHYNA